MAGVRSRLVSAAAAGFAALALAACAQLPSEVAVGVGTRYYEFEAAKPYAALYLPYARMSALAYADEQFLTPGGERPAIGQYCPLAGKLNDPSFVDRGHTAEANRELARWLAALEGDGWRCIYGRGALRHCPQGEQCVEGLQYMVWRRRDCSEAVIAFRGSDAGDVGDWLTNFRWFRFKSVFDQYDQVQAEVPKIIARLQASGCRPSTIVTTGHSLGGGLAQHVSYAGGVDYVYAFDPSPVTALFGVPFPKRMRSVERLGIDRVYERGEVLSLPRYLASGLYATQQCQPRVRIVRFATIDAAGLTERHRITKLTEGIEKQAAGTRPATLPTGFKDAATCDFVTPAG
jgi:hypothetical protein